MSKNNYNSILRIQRDQINKKEDELRYIAAHAEKIIDLLNKQVIRKNAEVDYGKDPLNEVIRGQTLDQFVNRIVAIGTEAGIGPDELS